MLLEDFLPKGWWHSQPWYAALLAAAYSCVSLFIATQVFAGNPGIVSVTFLTLFLLPSITLIRRGDLGLDDQTWAEKLFGPLHLTKAYTAYFAGTFSTYLLIAFLLPLFGVDVTSIVREQLILLPGITGGATFSVAKFASIFANNWFVLVLVFLFATIWRDGGMFFVQWNASAWGAIFGYRAMGAAAAAGVNPWYYLGVELGQVIWHTALEAGAYILAAVAGSVMGRHAFIGDELPGSFIASVTTLFLVTFGTKTALSVVGVSKLVSTLIGISVFFATAYSLRRGLSQNQAHFAESASVFAVSLALFAVGATVETFVLNNSSSLQTVYEYSNMFIQ